MKSNDNSTSGAENCVIEKSETALQYYIIITVIITILSLFLFNINFRLRKVVMKQVGSRMNKDGLYSGDERGWTTRQTWTTVARRTRRSTRSGNRQLAKKKQKRLEQRFPHEKEFQMEKNREEQGRVLSAAMSFSVSNSCPKQKKKTNRY